MAKKIIIIATIAIVAIIGAGIAIFSSQVSALDKKLKATVVEDIELADVKDGEYEGVYDLKIVNAKVTVFVKDSKILNISLDEHRHGPGAKYAADPIIEKIKQAQSLNVDAVSGATGSSLVVRKAVEIALKKGQGKIEEQALEAAAREESPE